MNNEADNKMRIGHYVRPNNPKRKTRTISKIAWLGLGIFLIYSAYNANTPEGKAERTENAQKYEAERLSRIETEKLEAIELKKKAKTERLAKIEAEKPKPETADEKATRIFTESNCSLTLRRVARAMAIHEVDFHWAGPEPDHVKFWKNESYIFSGKGIKFQNDYGVWTDVNWICKYANHEIYEIFI